MSAERARGRGAPLRAVRGADCGPPRGARRSSNVTLRDALFKINHNLSWLSLARLFLFASRDLWFEVPRGACDPAVCTPPPRTSPL